MTRANGRFEADAATANSNIESEDESESDFIIDFDLNDVKEEVKCEEEKPEKGKENASSMGWSSDADEPNSLDGQDNEQRDGSKAICKRLNANGKGKKRDGSRKQNRRKIPRNKAAKKRKEHKCHVCGYVTTKKCNLNAHIRIHTGERPYKCDQCSESFTLKRNLNRHKRIHSGSKPFKCSVCFKTFLQKITLNRHMRTHADELPRNLNRHLAQHCEQFPFGCIKCGRGFSTEGDKTAHEKICGRRQHQCYVCKVFKLQNPNLRHHMQVHHSGEKPFSCKWCDKRFTQKYFAK
ncbi:zinc finger protein 239-like [Sitodiplosis mosellana]|uniref:zinc finger protein 239-like n=1 Tax=Sitodiplosis mosellana TaxID=263140 RepID=UPI002443D7E1|nr:zinc finger protein 239-like [Sitodiplosis mosellana]